MEYQINYIHTVEMTKEEKLKMYMKLTKRELALMLIESNRHIGILRNFDVEYLEPIQKLVYDGMKPLEQFYDGMKPL